jgi:hypothetical protein
VGFEVGDLPSFSSQFHMNWNISYSISREKAVGILVGFALNVEIAF